MKHIVICLALLGSAPAFATDFLSQLRFLAEIDTETGKANGISTTQNWIASQLRELSFEVTIDNNGLLVAERKGTSPKIVTLLTHVDTVLAAKPLAVEGKVVKGSGVIDAKGGVLVAIEGLRRYLKDRNSAFGLRFVSSSSEEIGSPKLIESFRSLSKSTWLVLGFEPALDSGSIVTSRRGNRWYKITVTGKESHAGRAHREGINACRELAIKLEKLSKLTDYGRDVTVSIGHFEGGKDKYNVVCGHAEAKVDIRFSTIKESARMKTEVERILRTADIKGSTTTFEVVDDLPPFSATKESKKVADLYLKGAASIEGRPIEATNSGGGADSNFFARDGLMILDGLGPYGGRMHTEDEFLHLPSMESRSEALARFLRVLN